MKNLNELRKLNADAIKEARGILDKADAEKRALTAEEDKKVTDLMAQVETRKSDIVREEALQKEEAAITAEQRAALKTDPAETRGPQITQIEERVMIRQKNGTYKEGRAVDPKKEFRTMAEFMKAVVDAGMGHGQDARLSTRAATGASENVPSDGGFLVQQDFATELLARTYEQGQILSRVNRVPIGANSNGLVVNALDETSRADGSRWGGIQAYWANEADALTGTKPKFRRMELKLQKLTGLCYATDEMLADSTALEAVIMKAFPDEFVFKIEDAIINGTGAGQPVGILNSNCVVSVAKETGQVTKTVLVENIVNMWSRCWARSRRNAIWTINQDVEPQLLTMGITIGTGGAPIFMPAGGISGQQFNTLLGRPIVPVEYNATLGTVGDIQLIDPSEYTLIDKGGIQAAASIHVRFVNDEQVFRFIYRCDGQPNWNKALTPKNGTNTLSPFVSLATR